jgi:phytase-like protein
VKTFPILSAGLLATALFSPSALSATGEPSPEAGPFRRVSSFPVFLNTDVDDETVAEIVAATADGNTLIYTDGKTENIGFVDITDITTPTADGVVSVPGEPTSVAVVGGYALAAINTSADFINTSGDLVVIDIATRLIVRTIPLGGQPDAVSVSPDGQYAAIAIENERDEDLGDGEPPQLPAGFVAIVDLVGPVANWTTRNVDLVGVPDLYPSDPEPEFVDINAENFAVVTLQENNHLVVIDLETGSIVEDFSAGYADLVQIDTNENDLIEQNSFLPQVPREPDAVTWVSPSSFVTADEGDLHGGSRGFTSFYARGFPIYLPGRDVEHQVTRLGHYPEGRSENKGCEPEGAEFGDFGELGKFLFIGAERANLVLVYEIIGDDWTASASPEYVQTLPTGVGPEGLLAIPARNLFVVASEGDERGNKFRSVISIYSYDGTSNYPTIVSEQRVDGTPIPWGALSGLANGSEGGGQVFTVHDSFYRSSRIFELDVDQTPAVLRTELVLTDDHDVLRSTLNTIKNTLPGTPDFDVESFFNADGSVNLDIEGIDAVSNGFWLVSEGAGNLVDGVSDAEDRPFESPNLILGVDPNGNTRRVHYPRLNVIQNQLRFGFEGIAVHDNYAYVCFQRSWSSAGDPAGHARIGRYSLTTGGWQYAYYPLDAVASPAGGWVGLSEITYLGDGEFAILERDNQAGTDAAVKRIYRFDGEAVDWRTNAQVPALDVITKELIRDLLVEGDFDAAGGAVPEKLEGLCVLADGNVLIVNDNDGVDDNNGETQLLELGELFIEE